jgi:hypothetical protein
LSLRLIYIWDYKQKAETSSGMMINALFNRNSKTQKLTILGSLKIKFPSHPLHHSNMQHESLPVHTTTSSSFPQGCHNYASRIFSSVGDLESREFSRPRAGTSHRKYAKA